MGFATEFCWNSSRKWWFQRLQKTNENVVQMKGFAPSDAAWPKIFQILLKNITWRAANQHNFHKNLKNFKNASMKFQESQSPTWRLRRAPRVFKTHMKTLSKSMISLLSPQNHSNYFLESVSIWYGWSVIWRQTFENI